MSEQEVQQRAQQAVAQIPPDQHPAAAQHLQQAVQQTVQQASQTQDPAQRTQLLNKATVMQRSLEALQQPQQNPAGQSSLPPPPAGRVNVIGPDGRSGTIPESQVEQAKARGYKLQAGETSNMSVMNTDKQKQDLLQAIDMTDRARSSYEQARGTPREQQAYADLQKINAEKNRQLEAYKSAGQTRYEAYKKMSPEEQRKNYPADNSSLNMTQGQAFPNRQYY